MSEKIRVHNLAKLLEVSSKVIVEKCVAEGVDVIKNHMSTVSAGLQETIKEWFSEGADKVSVETATRVDLKKVRVPSTRKKKAVAASEATEKESAEDVGVAVADSATAQEAMVVGDSTPEVIVEAPPAVVPPDGQPETAASSEPVIADAVAETTAAPTTKESPADGPTDIEAAPIATPDVAEKTPPAPAGPVTPAGPQHVPTPAKLQGPRVVRYEAPEHDTFRRRPPVSRPAPSAPGSGPSTGAPFTSPDAPGKGAVVPGKRRARVNPRRAAARLNEAGERMAEYGNQDLQERKQRLAGATGRRMIHRRRAQAGGSQQAFQVEPKTEATVNEPIRLKEFCSATGLNFIQLFKTLRDEYDLVPNINMILPQEPAEMIALSYGIELKVVAAKTLLDQLSEEFDERPRKKLAPRPPVVTMLGHVDHGKTSLLDSIRRATVASGEDGGITQHISSYHIDSDHGPVTFVDTPGHKAFTEMRARGAQVTDVVILVIAADDGIMPQTVEAIQHAKAAEVPIVIALNKIDLGDDNKLKIFGQLAEHGLTPSGDWGGEIDVIPTSATTGTGITELVEHLADLSSVLDLKADPTIPAKGTVLEAETKTGVGSVANVLIREGTLRVGDLIVCGPASGKVRAIIDDQGNRIKSAGPSMPVEVWGLDEVPGSGDTLFCVKSMQRGKEIAAETKRIRTVSARLKSTKVRTLQDVLAQRGTADIPILNLIIKADVDGSIVAMRQALSEFPDDEVKLVIRHAAVGAVNDSDVLLAATSDGIVVAYRVDMALGAKRLSDMHGVDVRSYRVIYNVVDDVKKALEGLLSPEENIETRGRIEVRDLFRFGKKGSAVAGSLVVDGVIDRKHLIKVVRDGVVVREGSYIASLRRFKDDVKEVKNGFECGIRLEGFDDIHVGDVLESYEIVKTARTLA